MRDSEIKTLFAKADEQVHVDEIRKQKTYYAMIEEMEVNAPYPVPFLSFEKLR